MLVRAPKRVNVGTHTRSTVVTRPRAAPTRTVNGMWRSSAPNTFVPRRFASQKPDLPVSPHVTIYRQPLPAMTSITHRITGVALFAAFAYLGVKAWWINPDVYSYFAVVEDMKQTHPAIQLPLKLAFAGSLSYHFFAGVRHLLIESKVGRDWLDNIATVDKHSWAVIGASAASTAIIMATQL